MLVSLNDVNALDMLIKDPGVENKKICHCKCPQMMSSCCSTDADLA